jgi:polar amino acid transport system substrate-binding protein
MRSGGCSEIPNSKGSLVLMLLVFLFVGFSAGSVHAQQAQKTVSIAVGISQEPYVLKNGKGIISEIIKASFDNTGYLVEFAYLNNVEALSLFKQYHFDAVTVVRPGMVDAYFSVPMVTFQNYAVSLADSKVKTEHIADFARYRIHAFSNARRYLGAEFASVVNAMPEPKYQEVVSQEEQVSALFKGAADLIVADETIFKYYRKKLIKAAPFDESFRQAVAYTYAFPPTQYHIAFHNPSIQQAFDNGYRRLVAENRINEISDKYLKLLKSY